MSLDNHFMSGEELILYYNGIEVPIIITNMEASTCNTDNTLIYNYESRVIFNEENSNNDFYSELTINQQYYTGYGNVMCSPINDSYFIFENNEKVYCKVVNINLNTSMVDFTTLSNPLPVSFSPPLYTECDISFCIDVEYEENKKVKKKWTKYTRWDIIDI